MKEIKAIIQPIVASKVIQALMQIPNIPGITRSEVLGYGRTLSKHSSLDPKDLGSSLMVEKVKLETVVHDEMLKAVLDTIRQHAHTGNLGDGKIFVYTVDDVVRIRTGETGKEAI